MQKFIPPEGNMYSESSPDDISLYKVGTTIQLVKRCMIPAIPVGAIGRVVPMTVTDPIASLLAQRGKYVMVDFDLKPYNITHNGVKVDGILVFVGTSEIRPVDLSKHIDYVVMCVGSPLEEHTYAYYRPSDYDHPDWWYVVEFEEGHTIHHYFKGVEPEEYMIQFKKDQTSGLVTLVAALPKQALSPFHL